MPRQATVESLLMSILQQSPSLPLRLILLSLALLVISGCSAPGLGLRHQPSGLNSHFANPPKSFAAYSDRYTRIIREARVDLDQPDAPAILQGNAPFTIAPATHCQANTANKPQRGILLTHGLTDSPYSVHTIARYFADQCFQVMAIVLPGHGTRPGDLLDVTWQDWAAAEAWGVDTLARAVDEVYLLGFSTGGALAIRQAAIDPRIRGLFLFSPAVAVAPKARFSCWLDTLGSIWPSQRWLDIMPDADTFKYESFTSNAACQIWRLTGVVDDLLANRTLSLPVFIAASKQDSTVNTEATLAFFSGLQATQKTMLLYSATPTDVPAEVTVINSALPSQRILSSAHTAMTLPASDPHYGSHGDYALCDHYFDKPALFARCKAGGDFIGERTEENLKKGVIRRLTWNPQYSAMLQDLGTFIRSLP